MSMTSHPVSVLPATASQGNPAGVFSIRSQACSRALARARAIRSRMRGVPARSRARRTVGPLGAGPSTGDRCASRAVSLMDVAPSAIATASDASTVPLVQQRRAALPAQGGGQPGGQAELVGGLAEQDRAGVAEESPPVRGDLQGMIPPVKLHGEERSSEGNVRVVTANLSEPGALRPETLKGQPLRGRPFAFP